MFALKNFFKVHNKGVRCALSIKDFNVLNITKVIPEIQEYRNDIKYKYLMSAVLFENPPVWFYLTNILIVDNVALVGVTRTVETAGNTIHSISQQITN